MIAQMSTECLPFPDNSIDMIFTDPPYLKKLLHTYRWVATESMRVLKPGKFVAVMCGGIALNTIMRHFDDAGLTYYWSYVLAMGGRGSTCWRWSNGKSMPVGTIVKHILVYSKGPAISRTATVGYYKSKGKDKDHHAWGQDIDSHRYYIDCFSEVGDLVLDPMVGGGTTVAACKKLDRRWIVGDIDTVAINITKKRTNGVQVSLL